MGKVVNLSVKQKYEAIKMVQIEKKKVNDVAKFFKCGKSQIYNAINNKANIADNFESSRNLSKKKLRKENFESINSILLEWFTAARSKNLPISGPILKEKALEIAQSLKISNFTASNGWLESFKNNKKISFQLMAGERNDVDENIVSEWKSKLLEKTAGYELRNIANADECGLFFRVLPNRTFHFKGDKCHGGKNSKERITILLTAFADGTISKPLVIGKSENPRCFKNVNKNLLPVSYKANRKAWMTAALFTEYLEHLNRQMVKENRKILLFVDNATSHTKRDFSNLRLEFLPPNCTSALQPLDGGIIHCLKLYYRKLMLKKIIALMDSFDKATDVIKNISLLDAIMIIAKATKEISKSCVENCFKNCGFRIANETNVPDDNNIVYDELDCLLDSFNQNAEVLPVKAADYIAMDSNIFTENDVIDISSFLPSLTEEVSDEEIVEVVETISRPNTKEIFSSLKLLKDFAMFQGNFNLYEDVENVGFKIDDALIEQSNLRKNQTKIDNFFKKVI